MTSSAEYAVFTEFSPDTKPAMPGWNRRVFTDTDVRKGTAIQCDFKTGIVTLAPGAYHISGLSMVAYFTKDDPSGDDRRALACVGGILPAAVLRSRPPPSIRQIFAGCPTAIPASSASAARARPTSCPACSRPSTKPTGRRRSCWSINRDQSPSQIYLRVFVENSKWHAFARISIRGL